MDPTGPSSDDPRLRALLSDSVRMMEELSELTRRLASVGRGAPTDSSDPVGSMEDEFRAFQQRFGAFAADSRRVAADLDKSIRRSPYLYLIGATVLGFLLGKARRL